MAGSEGAAALRLRRSRRCEQQLCSETADIRAAVSVQLPAGSTWHGLRLPTGTEGQAGERGKLQRRDRVGEAAVRSVL